MPPRGSPSDSPPGGPADPEAGLTALWSQLWEQWFEARPWQESAPSLMGPAEVGKTPHETVFQGGTWRLLRYGAPPGMTEVAAVPLLMVPSLINRYYILDLTLGKSLVAYLLERGIEVYMIDWGTPGEEERFTPFSAYAHDRLHRAIQVIQDDSGSDEVSLLGYCMGGTFATIYTALESEGAVANLINLAGPINFHDDGLLSHWTRAEWFSVDRLVDTLGNIPSTLLQQTFRMLRPTGEWVQALRFYELLAEGSEEKLKSYGAMNTWVNDPVPFPGETFRFYVKELYQENKLVRDQLLVGGRPVRLADIRANLLTIAASQDHITPPASATILNEKVGSLDREIIVQPGGHIGIVAGSSAHRGLWPRLAGWLVARST